MIVYPLVSRYPWILGYMDTWILGYMDISFIWIHGYLDTLDINFFSLSIFWISYPSIQIFLGILFKQLYMGKRQSNSSVKII